MKEKIMKILQDDDCPLFMVFGELEQLVDYLIANSVTVETNGITDDCRQEILSV